MADVKPVNYDPFTSDPIDVALEEEGITGRKAAFIKSIYQQESGSGRNTKTSYADAHGGMQIIPATFDSLKDKGWDIKNPFHSVQAGVRYASKMYDDAKGDVKVASAGYYGGPNAFEKAKEGIPVYDPKNPKAPSTIEYGDKVESRLEKQGLGDNDYSDKKKDTAKLVPVEGDPFAVSKLTPAVGNPFQTAPQTAPNPTQAPQRTPLENVGRQLGLTARGAAGGLANTLDIPAAVVNPIVNRVAGTNLSTSPVQNLTNRILDSVGLAKPENTTERVVQAGVGGLTGGAGLATGIGKMVPAIASPIGQQIARTMSAAPASQAASGSASASAAQATKEAGYGQGAQTMAALTAGLLPFAPQGAQSAVKNVLRGDEGNIKNMIDRTKAFEEAGATPSTGQATANKVSQHMESLLSKVPGGYGVMEKFAKKQAEDIGKKATEIADRLSTTGTPSNAGLAIEKGISGDGGFLSRFKEGQKALYNKLDQYIKPDTKIDISKTKQTLATLNEDIPNAPELSKLFKNPKIQGIEESLKKDTGSTGDKYLAESGLQVQKQPTDKLPYESIKRLRTLVGDELSNPSIAPDVPRSAWKRLYGALSSDLDNAAISTGEPGAIIAMNRANAFTRAGHDRIERVLDNVVNKKTPEEIFKNATNTSDMQAGATKISSVMKSLSPAERDVVKSAFLRRMGQATASAQSAEGDVFSGQTFLTNWNKISPQAKSVLFSGQEGELRKSLDQIAKVSQYVKEGSQVFANPSGTARSNIQIGQAGAIGAAIASGHPVVAGSILLGNAASNLTAKLMINPKFTTWLAKSSEMSPATIPATVLALRNSMSKEPDDVKDDMNTYLNSLSDKPKGMGDLIKGTM